MALIGKIRNNMWLLVILIGLALAAFVIMDMTSGSGSGVSSDQFEMGEVNGTTIDWNDFRKMEQALYSNNSTDIYNRRDYLWNYYVNDAIVRAEAEALGLAVGRDELMELQFGTNLSPVIRQRFSNPQTGQVDRQQLNQLRTAIQQNQLRLEQKRFWQIQEREIISNRLQTKLSAIVTKGMYTPSWMAEQQAELQNTLVDFTYVKVPFAEIVDSDVDLKEEDYQNYLDEHKALYENEEQTRVAEYAVMEVRPTSEDSAQLRDEISELVSDFESSENDSLFVDINDGMITPTYQVQSEVDAAVSDTVFEMPIGSAYGPYKFEGAYKAVKLLDRKVIPDSAEARHIFRQVDPNTPNSYADQKSLLDSLKQLIEGGQASFDSLAMTNGMDASAREGGDLGYFGRKAMLPSFESEVFYTMEVGELKVIETNAGLHLVEVTDKKYIEDQEGVKLAYITRPIIPSEETQNRLYEEALTIASENRTLEKLNAAVQEQPNLQINTTKPLKRNDYQIEGITSPEASRSLVRYLYQSDVSVGDVSPDVFIVEADELFYNKQYIIAGLKNIIPEGMPKLEDVRAVIAPEVMKKKKGQLLKDNMMEMTLSSAADKYSVNVDSATNISLNSTFVTGLGNEPKVIAAIQDINEGSTGGPVIGNNGVYLIEVLSKTQSAATASIPQIRQQTGQKARQGALTKLMDALRSESEIVDKRYRFY